MVETMPILGVFLHGILQKLNESKLSYQQSANKINFNIKSLFLN